jgi:hypothetical protein
MERQGEEGAALLLRERERRHRRIVREICNYKKTASEVKLLARITQTTKAQIDLRFKHCAHNRTYKFLARSDAERDSEQFGTHSATLYDLYTQSEILRVVPTMTLSLEPKRRVKSL